MTRLPSSDALMFDPSPEPLACGATWCLRHGPLGDVDQPCQAVGERRVSRVAVVRWNPVTRALEAA